MMFRSLLGAAAGSAGLALALAEGPPLCTRELLDDVEGFLVDLDGTMYGDLSKNSQGLNAFIDGAEDFHSLLTERRTPLVYLSNSGAKGPEGIDAKFKALGITGGTGGVDHAWTAANGVSAWLNKNAPRGAKVLLMDSVFKYGGQVDSCLRVVQRASPSPLPWDLKIVLDDEEAKSWAEVAQAGGKVFVAWCADGDPSTEDGGPTETDPEPTKHAIWLLQNGATMVFSAPDDFNGQRDANHTDLHLWLPGPGPWHAFYKHAGSIYDEQRDRTVGKGGNDANEFMYAEALKLLQKQAGSSTLEPSRLAMVGDTLITDVAGGQNFGTKTIWLTETGIDGLQDLKNHPGLNPTCHLPSIKDLVGLLSNPIVV